MTRKMTSVLTPSEPPTQEVDPRYASVEPAKQVVKKADKEPKYTPVCHLLMTKNDKEVKNNQPTNRHAEKREQSPIPPNKGQPIITSSTKLQQIWIRKLDKDCA